MATTPSLLLRLAVAKGLGFVIGLCGFAAIPLFWPDATLGFRLGIWGWYLTLGAMVGLMGLMDRHPLFSIPLPFWLRGIILGGWLNFVLVLVLHDTLDSMMASFYADYGFVRNPMWFVAEGMIVGVLIDWAATRFGGEGKECL